MSKSLRSEVIKALKDQREIYGDELFTNAALKTEIVTEKTSK